MPQIPAEENSPITSASLNLDQQLEQSLQIVTDLGADFTRVHSELETVRQRLGEGRFHLAVLGQFKRGKSTLLNALLGDDLLPTDILPVTAIPTFIQAGPELGATVYFLNNSGPATYSASADQSLADFLGEYVTEVGNPQNKRQVSRVEISHPATLLQQGVVLIDTPGVGSTLKHNTEVAHQVLPQCDAALFLVSPDPPITEMELEYLQQIKQRLPRTFYLLNKVDFLDEQETLASLRFLGEQLSRFYSSAPQIMPISARRGLQARLSGDDASWKQSGMQLVEQNLIDFFAREKQQTLNQALTRRTDDLLNDLVMQLQLSLTALTLPSDELQKRLDQFRQALPAIEREQHAASDVLQGDLKRVIEHLGQEVEKVREKAKKKILAQVDQQLDSVEDPELLERNIHALLAEEVSPFFSPAMRAMARQIEQKATELLRLNQQRSTVLIEQVRQVAAELFDIPYQAPAADASYVKFAVPAWSDDLFISDMDPLGQRLSRRFFTKKYRLRRTVKRLREESRKLINQNIAQISWTVQKSLDESFRNFSADLSDQLEKTIAATRKAMEVAFEQSASHSRDTAAQEILLKQAIERLKTVRCN